MRKLFFHMVAATLFVASPALAEAPPPDTAADAPPNPTSTFEQRVAGKLKEQKAHFWTLTTENDLFGSGNDENYTNGARLTYHKVGEDPYFLAEWLGDMLPTFKVNKSTTVYYALGQNLYTPENIAAPNPAPTDRPYAAFLYGSAGFSSINGDHIDDIELTLGVIGPAALGEETQTLVHKAWDIQEPEGWDFQLKNEPALMLSWQRRWPELVGEKVGPFYFRVMPHTGATVGNVYTYGAGGVTLQLTPNSNRWQSQPLRVRPSIPGSGFFEPANDLPGWSLFLGTEGRAVARDITLDGNTFKSSRSVRKRHFVADISGGLTATFGHIRTSYTLNWRSKEFHGQDGSSLFGAISVGWRF